MNYAVLLAVHVAAVKIIVFVSNFDYETFDAFCLPPPPRSSIQSNVSNRFDVIATINTHEELYVEEGERAYTHNDVYSQEVVNEGVWDGLNLSIRIDSTDSVKATCNALFVSIRATTVF